MDKNLKNFIAQSVVNHRFALFVQKNIEINTTQVCVVRLFVIYLYQQQRIT